MKRAGALFVVLFLVAGCQAADSTLPETAAPKLAAPAEAAPKPAPAKRRGFAVAEEGRPAHFPHRIWAFSDFEARPEGFGWFGGGEAKNIANYPGNTAARRATASKPGAAAYTGMNPVPGPCMGKVNKLCVRYYIKGTDTARFQHFSLSSSDNCNILVSGLKQGAWSETVLNFTEDSRRNDGSPNPFKEGERMDDLKVYITSPKPADPNAPAETPVELIIDDPIFFAEDPALPPEPEAFPRRVMFLAAFDTGIDAKSKPTYFPGEFDAAGGAQAPKGSYWTVAKAVARAVVETDPNVPAKMNEGATDWHVMLEMKPPRPVGPNTRARFRYWVKGAGGINVVLHDATDKKSRAVAVKNPKQGEWATQYVTFSAGEKAADGTKFAARNEADSIAFVIPAAAGAELYIDEVVLYDAEK